MTSSNAAYNWQRQPEAEKVLLEILDQAVSQNPFLHKLKEELRHGCSTVLLEWVDYVSVNPENYQEKVEKAGFDVLETREDYQLYRHEGAKLPDIALKEGIEGIEVGISVESIAHFLQVRGLHKKIEGTPFSGLRRCLVDSTSSVSVFAIERRGHTGLYPTMEEPGFVDTYFKAYELWMTRSRSLKHEDEDFETALHLANQIVSMLGKDAAACLILGCEREYWQARNTAGQIQKNRQDKVGMGWANHDHHTFRSSRKHFQKLVKLFEILGFNCRERYYTGKEAGWGAQIMENPQAKLVLFLDVDLSDEEIAVDFAHDELPQRYKLGTIGLWCALHGDSILHAGMHHLEAQFEFDDLAHDLKNLGIRLMDPFSNFPYLKQAFTQGEIWHVAPERIDKLLTEKLITEEQGDKFRRLGALGSHLENLQRKEGYKGFNQKNVSLIIKKTDPRLTAKS